MRFQAEQRFALHYNPIGGSLNVLRILIRCSRHDLKGLTGLNEPPAPRQTSAAWSLGSKRHESARLILDRAIQSREHATARNKLRIPLQKLVMPLLGCPFARRTPANAGPRIGHGLKIMISMTIIRARGSFARPSSPHRSLRSSSNLRAYEGFVEYCSHNCAVVNSSKEPRVRGFGSCAPVLWLTCHTFCCSEGRCKIPRDV